MNGGRRRSGVVTVPSASGAPHLRASDGRVLSLPGHRWSAAPSASDLRVLERVEGPVLDVGSEGNIGLRTAVEGFDPAKGGKLSTYAAGWSKQSIKRALANQGRPCGCPATRDAKCSTVRAGRSPMNDDLGREPTYHELGEESGIAAGKVSQLKTVSIRPAALDAPISDDDSTEFGEIVGDEEAQTPFELLRDKNLRNEVGGLLDVLDDRERKIIFSRFGLDGGKPKTLEEVGKKFGVTRERIRQLQNIALSKLRRALSKKERPVDVELTEA